MVGASRRNYGESVLGNQVPDTRPTYNEQTLLNFQGSTTDGFSGTDTFTYKDTNAIGTSNTATITLTVQ